MSLKWWIANMVARLYQWPARFLGDNFYSLFSEHVLKRAVQRIELRNGSMRLSCPNHLTLWRGNTLFSKEPETIEWIESFKEGDILWDVGANIGLYSLYAAMVKKTTVLAFEPSAANYFTLCRNIELNNLDGLISAYCLAFNDSVCLDKLNMTNTGIGEALSSFGVTKNVFGQSFIPSFRQGMIGFSMDEFIKYFNSPIPTHLKIDVDGIEGSIISGARELLKNPLLKSISIELDDNRKEEIVLVTDIITSSGFHLKYKRHAAMFDGGEFESCYNYLFLR